MRSIARDVATVTRGERKRRRWRRGGPYPAFGLPLPGEGRDPLLAGAIPHLVLLLALAGLAGRAPGRYADAGD